MLRERIKKEIQKIVPRSVEFSVFRPERAEFGDYFSNVALAASKILKKNPQEVAKDLKNKLEKSALFSKIASAGPGFLNFWVAENEIAKGFHKLVKKGLPRLNLGKNKKVQVEFVSANPTGPLTLANGRGGFLGDVLANILELSGHKVEREYYVNDTGKQIIALGKSILASAGIIPGEEIFYKSDYIKRWTEKNKIKVKKFKNDPLRLGQEAAQDFLKSIKNSLEKKAKIKFDRWTSEDRHIYKRGFIKQARALFEKKNLSYKKDGAIWLKTSEFADDKDRVLITSDGFPTYFLADAGHYLETFSRGFKKKINILGPDHYGYVARIQAVAEMVGMDDSEIIVTQTVRLMKGGQEFKMSKRKGIFVVFEDLIDEIGLDAARWFFLARSADTHMDIDLELAKEKSQKNPVYYVQYAHARMASILRKAQTKSYQLKAKSYIPEELKFVKKLLEIEEALEDAARDYQIHRITTYAYELAQAFSEFYRDVKVIGSGSNEPRRLFIVNVAKNILASLLGLMGISAPERM